MTKIPKILYHGTTGLRYMMIRKSGIMNCHMSKYYNDDKRLTGYIFFTDNTHEAALYGLVKLLTDLRMAELKEDYNSSDFIRSRDSIVLAVRTSHLNFEIDPEHFTVKLPDQERHKDKLSEYEGTLYRHRGEIPLKYLLPYKTVPYSWFEENQKGRIDMLNEKMDHYEKRRLQ